MNVLVITCEEPFKPKNGEVFSRRRTFGTSVSFTCNPGYNLVGSRELQCTGEGEWSGMEPTCEGEPHCSKTNCQSINLLIFQGFISKFILFR